MFDFLTKGTLQGATFCANVDTYSAALNARQNLLSEFPDTPMSLDIKESFCDNDGNNELIADGIVIAVLHFTGGWLKKPFSTVHTLDTTE